jgi:glycosyltransferase involved in cell wall biosynthesis
VKAVLLPNMVEFPAISMKRYARELANGLRTVGGSDWEFEELVCNHAARIANLIPGEPGERMASQAGRFVKYPRMISRAIGDVFHVLDHSHANLTLSLAPGKAVLTCHDIIPYLAAKGLVPIPTGRLTKYTFPQRIRCMKRCRYVIAISENTKRDLVEHAGLPAERVVVVYYGVNPSFRPAEQSEAAEQERQALRCKYQIPEEARVILHVGTATRYKNTPALLHALKALREDAELGPKVWLLRVGADFFEDEEELIGRLGLKDRIVHAGRIFDDAVLAAHYRVADVFAFPSLWEGFGWPPLEAMACGTPVVTSNVASLPEVVADGGLTVEPRDHAALAAALHRILTDGALRADLRAKAAAHAGRFTWERCARETLAVYERVIKEQES